MTGNIKAIPNDKIAAARAAAEEERKRIADENYKLGVRVGEGHKAWAFGLAGVIVGAVLMGLYTMATSERAMFNAGAVADRVLGRVIEPAQLEAPEVDPLAYERNTQAAREDACREGVRDRQGQCPQAPSGFRP